MGLSQVQRLLRFRTERQGLHEITPTLRQVLAGARLRTGVMTVMVQHTSASLIIQENADPSARRDLEAWLARLAPENDPRYTHTAEGPDDMPAHLRAALTRTSEQIPFQRGVLMLGQWQGVFLWEHRHRAQDRRVVVHMLGE